jgi:D-arabinose 1-dehydrogenase-like Zn-dependent alcohol dehydrogenase
VTVYKGLRETKSGAVSAHFSWDKLETINAIFARMEDGRIDGRIVANLQ